MSDEPDRQAQQTSASATDDVESEWVVLGRISGLYGVRGWVRVYSHTSPRDNILNYSPWYLRRAGRWERVELKEGKAHGKGIVAQLKGYTDRDRASELLQADIAVRYDQLPALEPDEYYWANLKGLRVQTTEGVELGVIDHLFETGANDVMVVKGERERLIPFLQRDVIQSIDLEAGVMIVDWDPEF